MLSSLGRTAVLLLLAFAAIAQPSEIGEPFPLTDTRYATARGHDPLLTSNGRDPILFWSDDRFVRVTRLVNNRAGMSRAVLANDSDSFYDALWTGSHVLVVGSGGGWIFSRIVDANGEPRGEPFVIAQGRSPRIAFNGKDVLLLYVPFGAQQVSALLLTGEGRPAEPLPRPLGVTSHGRIAVASNGDSFAALVPHTFDPTLLLFDAHGQLTSSAIFGQYGLGVAIASDGRRYLGVAACGDGGPCQTAYSRLIEADGAAGPAVDLDPPFRTKPSVAWDGKNWSIAYLRDAHRLEGTTLQVVQLDPTAQRIERRGERPAVETSLGVFEGRLLAAWIGEQSRGTIFVGDPFESTAAAPASFAATQQVLPVSKSSADGVLVVWQERGGGKTTLHTGVRAHDGSWSERQILSVLPGDCYYCYEETVNVMVAGDGREFLLYTHGAAERVVRRLDGNGNPIGDPFPLPDTIHPWQILWDGDEYLLFHGDRSIARMTASGTITSTATLPADVGQSLLYASDGDGRLIAVRIAWTIINHEQRFVGLAVVRLDRDLTVIDEIPIRLGIDDPSVHSPAVGWDGKQYVVAWSSAGGVMAAQIPATGAAAPKSVRIGDGTADGISIAPVSDGAAIQWNKAWGPNSLAFLRHDGSTTTPVTISMNEDRGYESGQIAPLAHGDLAYIESSLQADAPFESTTRVMFRVLSNAPLPPRPAAPHLTLSDEGTLTWDAPRQRVDGFRLETRADDGPWTEIAPALPRDARSIPLPLEPGSRRAFRIRAWNAGGTGAYSNTAFVNPPRRRSVH